jgi:hypothetical protein
VKGHHLYSFLARLAKGNVSFLPSVGVCRPLTFHILIFSETLQVAAMFVNGSGRNKQSL